MINLSIYLQCLIVFVLQLIFIYARTLNVEATTTKQRWRLAWTGTIVHLSWLISLSLGVNAVIKGEWTLILFSLIGGLLGADLAITGYFYKQKN